MVMSKRFLCIKVRRLIPVLAGPRFGDNMAVTKRLAAIFASGLLLGAAALAGAKKTPHTASPPMPDEPQTSVPAPQPVPEKPKEQKEQKEPNPGVPPMQPVGLTSRHLAIFAAGLLLIAAFVAAAWMIWSRDLSLVRRQPKTSVAAPQFAACPSLPAVASAGERDGKFPLQADVSGLIAADIASFIVIGKEATSEGRPRDAEVAFLMACRVADKLKGDGSVESADARYELGSHYAKVALDGGSAAAANSAELLRRAEFLYADGSQAYLATYGQAHEKTRFAAAGLAAVRQKLTQVQPAPVLVPKLATGNDGSEKLPKPTLPGAGTALTGNPLPATDAEVKTRQDSPVIKDCPEAVATLGLCNSGN
ncbi:MAG: hypothetical protein ABIQ90_03010 [Polaromonas sp.]